MTPRLRKRVFDLSKSRFGEDLSPIIQRVLLARGISSELELDQRLSTLESPETLAGIDAAIDLLEQALVGQKTVLVCGDYDADGATATALIIRILRDMGLEKIDFLVPNRFDFGYGLSPELVKLAAKSRPDLIITVDNGISSIEGVATARKKGIKVLVTDHHLPGPELPSADAIVNPNQTCCHFPSKNLAGVGVVFYLMIALRARLRSSKWFEKNHRNEPRLERYLDIVALGTVADLVPLDRLNRIFVSQGLKLLQKGQGNPGIKALLEISGREVGRVKSSDLGFAVGPRINAAGRLDDITEGIICLLTDDAVTAHQCALDLHSINLERRQIQDQMQADADRSLESIKLDQANLPWGYCCYEDDWHQGLVGLVAARVKDSIHRPVIAFARSEDGTELKGSARSIPGLHIRDCLERVHSQNPGLIRKFGGHAMAAGLSISGTDYELFAEAFDKAVRTMISEDDLQSVIWTDGELHDADFSIQFAAGLETLLPWGQGIPEPQFEGSFNILDSRCLKEKHLKMQLAEIKSAQVLDAIWFNAPPEFLAIDHGKISAVYRLGINRFRGNESLQLQLIHAEQV